MVELQKLSKDHPSVKHPATASSWDLPMIKELAEHGNRHWGYVPMGHAFTRRKS